MEQNFVLRANTKSWVGFPFVNISRFEHAAFRLKLAIGGLFLFEIVTPNSNSTLKRGVLDGMVSVNGTREAVPLKSRPGHKSADQFVQLPGEEE